MGFHTDAEGHLWFYEDLFKTYGKNLLVEKKLVDIPKDEKSNQQSMAVFDNLEFGRVLALDGIIQLAAKDEYIYHEMLVHPALFSHTILDYPHVSRVLVIGGGDGGVLRELLRHQSVDCVDMVEYDRRVVDISCECFPNVSHGAFMDSRARLHIGDGAKFVSEYRGRKYHVIIIDSSDPVGPNISLFTDEFYENIRRNCMEKESIVIRQIGSWFHQRDIVMRNVLLFGKYFKYIKLIMVSVPSYPSQFLLCMASNAPVSRDLETITECFEELVMETRYYSPEIHQGSQIMPREIVETIKL